MRFTTMMAFGVLFCGLFLMQTRAADEPAPASKTWTGVIIDEHCADKMASKENPQQAAASHDKACAIKCCSGEGALGLMVNGKFHKFDENGNTLAKGYLAKPENGTTASVSGFLNGSGVLVVSAINPAMAVAPKN